MKHFSAANRAYLDFDTRRVHDRRRHTYYRASPRLRPIFTVLRMVGLRPAKDLLCMERTRRGWHVVITLEEKLLPAETVALQLALGDDQRRGALNLMRAIAIRKKRLQGNSFWSQRWNILFSGKVK